MSTENIAEGFDFFAEDPTNETSVAEDVQSEAQEVVPEEVQDLDVGTGEGAVAEGEVEPQTEESKVDPETKRYEYWQSKHDELRNKYSALEQQVTAKKDYEPIAEYLYQNPQALLKLQEQLSVDTSQVVEDRSPKLPEKPERPANYNAYEAINDVESESFKYNQAQADYQTRMLEYMQEKQAYTEQQQKAEQQKQYEQYIAQQKQLQFKADLLANGLKEDEFEDFNQLMYSQDSLKPENIIKYYRLLRQKGQTKEDLAKEAFEAQRRRINNNPVVPGSSGGDSTKVPDENDLFNQSMLNYRR